MANQLPLIVVSSGEPAGIGPDISLALASRPFPARLAVLGDLDLMRARARLLGSRIVLRACTDPGDVAEHEPGRLHVLP
ncbi:MAG TPA: 4-hydroxythreonine-4-phosphate dehydrogenase, partial [Gammaproteobacteria bacterium]|nr:4-hydroxythreonine-4-phosphate dehydrogenase [Gammaproteobacteria bacterium]